MGAITNALRAVLDWIYSIVANYGWSIVIFTVLIKVVLMPLDIKNRKGMRKMAQIQPELNKLQKKYANDKQKLQQKQQELMRKERYSPLSGCLPMLVQMPILFAMFGAMRALASVTSAPAAVLGAALGTLQASCGRLAEGGLADLCVFDPQARWVVAPAALRSQGKHTPFAGYELTGRVRSTLVGGHFAHGA